MKIIFIAPSKISPPGDSIRFIDNARLFRTPSVNELVILGKYTFQVIQIIWNLDKEEIHVHLKDFK